MSKYDLDKLEDWESGMEPNNQEEPTIPEPKYGLAFLAGLGASVLVAGVLAAIGIILKAEYWYALIFGAIMVGAAIRAFVPSHSAGGAVIGAILCPATYFIYQLIINLCGYCYSDDDGTTFWWMLGLSAIVGLYLGYHKDEN